VSVLSPRYFILFSGRLISGIGDWIYTVALSFLLANQSPFALTVLWTIRMAVVLGSRFFVGSITDRMNPKVITILSDIVRAVVIFIMPWCVHSWMLFVLVFIATFMGALFSSAFSPMITLLTTVENRQRVNATLSALGNIALFLGPAIGGFLVTLNDSLPFIVDAFTFVVSAISLFFVPIHLRNPVSSEQTLDEARQQGSHVEKNDSHDKVGSRFKIWWDDVNSSWRFVFRNRMLLGMTFTFMVFGLTAPIEVNEAMFVTKAVHLTASSYGIVVTASGLAALLGDFINMAIGSKIKPQVLYAVGVFIIVLGTLLYAFSINLWMLLASSVLTGMGLTTMYASSATLEQNYIPVELQGRVLNAYHTLPDIVSYSAILLAGLFTIRFPIRDIVIVSACLSVLALLPAYQVLKYDPTTVRETNV
jgi:MFS family permease